MKLSDIKNKRSFAKGKRGLIYVGEYKGKKIAIKKQRKDIAATNTVNNEAEKLFLLNRYSIGPRILLKGKDYFAYEFVEGKPIVDFIASAGKKDIIRVMKDVFYQMYILDLLGMNKEEMHHPVKHIIVTKERIPVLIDFERCKYAAKNKNVTQFCQFVVSENLSKILKKKKISLDREKILALARDYKRSISEDVFDDIINALGSSGS